MNTKSTISTIVLGFIVATSVAHGEDLAARRASGLEQASQASITQAPKHALTRAEVIADLPAWRATGLEQAHAGEETPDTFSAAYRAKLAVYQQLIGSNGAQAPKHALTRAEVTADLAAWRASGLEQAHAGEETPDTSSAVYHAKLARYQQLAKQG